MKWVIQFIKKKKKCENVRKNRMEYLGTLKFFTFPDFLWLPFLPDGSLYIVVVRVKIRLTFNRNLLLGLQCGIRQTGIHLLHPRFRGGLAGHRTPGRKHVQLCFRHGLLHRMRSRTRNQILINNHIHSIKPPKILEKKFSKKNFGKKKFFWKKIWKKFCSNLLVPRKNRQKTPPHDPLPLDYTTCPHEEFQWRVLRRSSLRAMSVGGRPISWWRLVVCRSSLRELKRHIYF